MYVCVRSVWMYLYITRQGCKSRNSSLNDYLFNRLLEKVENWAYSIWRRCCGRSTTASYCTGTCVP